MRHKVIEKMFRDQFSLRNCDQVDVTFIMTDLNGISEFLIEDYVTDHKGYTTLRKSILKIGIINQKIKKFNK
jgi:hypothetical protein